MGGEWGEGRGGEKETGGGLTASKRIRDLFVRARGDGSCGGVCAGCFRGKGRERLISTPRCSKRNRFFRFGIGDGGSMDDGRINTQNGEV